MPEGTRAQKFDFPISNIKVTTNPKFGKITNVIIDFYTVDGFKKSKIYFLVSEIEEFLGYRKIRNIINRMEDTHKLLLRTTNFKSPAAGLFNLNIPNRGTLLIDISGLQRVIFNSKLPIAMEYQDWIFDEVIPNLWTDGMYINPIKVNRFVQSLFSTTIYNQTETNNNLRTLNLKDYEEYKYIINNSNYVILENDRLLKMRLYDIAFFRFTGRKLSQMSDISIENPYITALDIGGKEMVENIFACIYCLLRELYCGYPIEYLENREYGGNLTYSGFNIPNKGKMYMDYQNSKKNPVKVDLDELYKNTKKNEKDVGLNKDKNVES